MTLRILCDALEKILREDPLTANDEVFFYDCGDFYHISKIRIDKCITLERK